MPQLTQPSALPVTGIRGVGTALAEQSLDLRQLAERGLIDTPTETLEGFGFTCSHVAGAGEDATTLGARAARAAMVDAGIEPAEIDLLVWAGALPQSHLRSCADGAAPVGGESELLARFRYAAGWLQEELGLHRADVTAVTQQGYSSMFSAVRVARAMLASEPRLRNALCVGADVLPAGSTREVLYNVISDAGCAAVLSRGHGHDRIVDCAQVSSGYYWDPLARRAEIVAAYFPTARAVITDLLDRQRLTAGDVDMVIPTGVARASWKILLRLVGIDPGRLYDVGESFGHTLVADSFIGLQRLRHRRDVPTGARVLLFTYGFGSTWSAMLLEH